MPAQWTADIIGEMHLNSIKKQQLAHELNVSLNYVGLILNGHRSPPDSEAKFRAALNQLLAKQKKNSA